MKITVTQNDIDNGRIGQPESCALALAIGRAAGHTSSVGFTSVMIEGEVYSLPKIAEDFRRDFDSYKKVEPIEFEIS